jgi:hypothetical protein
MVTTALAFEFSCDRGVCNLLNGRWVICLFKSLASLATYGNIIPGGIELDDLIDFCGFTGRHAFVATLEMSEVIRTKSQDQQCLLIIE